MTVAFFTHIISDVISWTGIGYSERKPGRNHMFFVGWNRRVVGIHH